eukprot:2196172-Prymnesium_polylepis.3
MARGPTTSSGGAPGGRAAAACGSDNRRTDAMQSAQEWERTRCRVRKRGNARRSKACAHRAMGKIGGSMSWGRHGCTAARMRGRPRWWSAWECEIHTRRSRPRRVAVRRRPKRETSWPRAPSPASSSSPPRSNA